MRFDGPDRWVILRQDAEWYVYDDDLGDAVMSVPPMLDTRLRGALARRGDFTLPVFSNAPESILRAEFPALATSSDWQFVSLPADHDHTPRAPFELPLRIAAIGDAASDALAKFLDHSFVSEAIANGALDPHAPPREADIIITDGTADRETLPRARLVIAFGVQPYHYANNAMIWLPSHNAAAEVDSILMDIVHDQPLHRWLAQRNRNRPPGPLLIADPETNQALRMADAFAAVARTSLDEELARPTSAYDHAVPSFGTTALDLSFNFVRETTGLLPLSRMRTSRTLPAHAPSAQEQRRRVDARIERVDYVPEIDRYENASQALWVGADRTLRRGGRYRLRVQIGRKVPGNLIREQIADVLLPSTPDEAWDLDVALFAKDFRLTSPSRQPLRLPKGGASQPVWFDIVAPNDLQRAELRFAIYLHNNLLQSFRLSAALAHEEVAHDDGIEIDLDLAVSDAFANLDAVEPRALSIGVNENASGGGHTLLAKIDEIAEDFGLSAQKLDAPLADYRQILTEATVSKRMPLFPSEDVALTPEQRVLFEATIRRLARTGSRLFDALFANGSEECVTKLREIMKSPGHALLFPRHDENFAIPWAVVYDFTPPNDDNAPVCDGRDANGAPCGHKVTDKQIICINGFWGIRHAIEERLPSRKRRNAIRSIEKPAKAALLCTADAAYDGACDDLVTALTPDLGVIAKIEKDDDVLDVLWQSESRPAVMMLLGHLEPEKPGIDCTIDVPGKLEKLTAHDVIQRAKFEEWKQPNTLVLLMACSAMDMKSTTLNSHALAFSAAGAAAVVGAECPIFSKFACRFVRDLLLSLVRDKLPLGVALSEFRRRVVRAGNPLGFAFTAFGDTNVQIV